jgi:hypothetical protein
MNAVMDEPAALRRCKIEEVFADPFIELITLAPKNPVVRGLILSQTHKMPGTECETFDQIKEWVETTCEKKVTPPNTIRTPSRDGIIINVDFSETEYGSANYSVSRSGSDEFVIDDDELVGMVRSAIDDGDGIDVVLDTISEEINDNAWNRCDPDMEDYGEYDFSDYESNDTANSEVEYSRSQIRDRLLAFLQERHPQLLEELA